MCLVSCCAHCVGVTLLVRRTCVTSGEGRDLDQADQIAGESRSSSGNIE